MHRKLSYESNVTDGFEFLSSNDISGSCQITGSPYGPGWRRKRGKPKLIDIKSVIMACSQTRIGYFPQKHCEKIEIPAKKLVPYFCNADSQRPQLYERRRKKTFLQV